MSDELLKSWVTAPLSELLTTLESGSRPRGGVRGIAEGVPSIGGEHLNYSGGFNFDSVKYVPKSFAAAMTKGRIQCQDILVVKDGATTGKTAFVDSQFPYDEAFVNEHVFICRPTKEIESQFLFRFLTSMDGQKRILENFKGSAQGGINQTFAPNTEIPLAPLPEQRRIVAKLEKLLGKVDASQQRLERIPVLLKRFRQSVLAAACSGRLTADWREDAAPQDLIPPEPVSPDEISEVEETVEAPEAWRWLPLHVLCDPDRSICYGVIKLGVEMRDGIPCLRTSDVRPLLIDTTDVKRISPAISDEYRRTLLRGGEVLVNVRGTLGGVAVVPDSLRGWNISREVAVVPIKGVLPQFIAFWIASLRCQNWLSGVAKGVAYTGINIADLKLLPVALPSLPEQQEIVRRVEGLLALADQLEMRLAKARGQVDHLTPSLLARAFRGELVPQDPTDEPASVLLKRIRKQSNGSKLHYAQAQKKTNSPRNRRSNRN